MLLGGGAEFAENDCRIAADGARPAVLRYVFPASFTAGRVKGLQSIFRLDDDSGTSEPDHPLEPQEYSLPVLRS